MSIAEINNKINNSQSFKNAAREICAGWEEGNFARQECRVWRDEDDRIHIYGDAHNWCVQAKRALIRAFLREEEKIMNI